ncbi:MAG: MBL fold metallo-hydrolase [Maricaulis sp.]|jgi:glyoxylase-like metal-dependent hydrolase (beta-lactamase superfamily II)|nr:MBL fold metallo-hydrolase [Maricaulis sp.]HAQ35755.1 MBL fold metallo-hydrolase [Alphaproteobacteria bacterium]|tara:strand:+ start:377 stop:1243 length:867 start_codon:yes stop_codon:yes gene_type:complete
MHAPEVESFFHNDTYTVSHLVWDRETRRAALVDPVMDYCPHSGRTGRDATDRVIERIRALDLTLDWILETHIHADHLSGAQLIKAELGGTLSIGEHVPQVQRIFAPLFGFEPDFPCDGSQFDRLFDDDERFRIGNMEARAIWTPGHTPACMSYLIGDALFVGDTLFMPDFGSARCDFPGGDAATLYQSIRKLYDLPGETRMFLCHDYESPDRDGFVWQTTVGEQRRSNIHIRDGISESDFVAMRTERDATLNAPRLLLPSVQVNIRAGHLPPADGEGRRFLKIPLDTI